MKCQKCNETNHARGSRFCHKCGSLLESSINVSNNNQEPNNLLYCCDGIACFREYPNPYTGHLEVPAVLDNQSVKTISLTEGHYSSISIPPSVVVISGCGINPSLSELFIPSNVQIIEEYAFTKCSNLKSIVLSEGLSVISKGMCSMCASLSSVSIPNSVVSIESLAFSWCEDLRSIIIPNSVVSIGSCAFSNCKNLSTVVLSNSLVSIGSQCFEYCNLRQVIIPNTVKVIEYGAFGCCKQLRSVYIPNSVESIGRHIFGGCDGIYTISIGRGNYEKIKEDVPNSATVSFID